MNFSFLSFSIGSYLHTATPQPGERERTLGRSTGVLTARGTNSVMDGSSLKWKSRIETVG